MSDSTLIYLMLLSAMFMAAGLIELLAFAIIRCLNIWQEHRLQRQHHALAAVQARQKFLAPRNASAASRSSRNTPSRLPSGDPPGPAGETKFQIVNPKS